MRFFLILRHWNRLILVKCVLGLLAAQMDLLFDPDFIARSDLCLQFFSEALLSELLLTPRIDLAGCLRTDNLLMVVVRLCHVWDSLERRARFSYDFPLEMECWVVINVLSFVFLAHVPDLWLLIGFFNLLLVGTFGVLLSFNLSIVAGH